MAHVHCLNSLDNGRKQMNKIRSLISITAFAFAMIALPVAASAQWQGQQNRGDDFWGGGRNMLKVRSTIDGLRNRAITLDRQVSRVDDRRDSRRNDRNDRFDTLSDLTGRFKNATVSLATAFGRGRNVGNSRDEARRVLDLASQIDREMSDTRGRGRNMQAIDSQWRQIESDLRTIANAYGLRYNGRS
jgi:hypothetical protein